MVVAYEAVIGLEVHVQLLTRSKMFCPCPNRYGGEPNSRTCPVCLGLPGALPTLNGEAVQAALRLGLALDARIQPRSTFYRKQYFYPDLPKGYQITQGPVALVEDGHLDVPGDPAVRGAEGPVRAGILRAHLEEDAGKSLHGASKGFTWVDLNRAGVPLLEIVGAPDLRSAQEASDYLKALHRLVVFLGICDGNLEEGSFRCDANVSVRRPGAPFGTRVEIKNLNSFRHVRQALAFEVDRQTGILEAGGAFRQETRGWDADLGETRPQRSKEEHQDYRTFPEPDLPPLQVSPAEVAAARAALPELPWAREARFIREHGLTPYEAGMLLQSPAFAACFEAVAAASGNGKQAANWMLGDVSRVLNARNLPLEALGLAPEHLGELIRLVEARTLNLKTAREVVFPALLAGEGSPQAIVAARGLGQVRDAGAIRALVDGVLAAHPAQVAEYRGGKALLRGFFVGQVMKAGGGKADPALVNACLDEALAEGEASHGA
ncbi:Asp-tRNA(Asn)/Glu-tRNA(Gln) amidotransferase subunit GatB [Mesoterricola sediminis]|uniref:Aspartyl/glutamyl-tRNA(Asn/Gln) amidotransferase subunit B n=1 Tax=Mesoterricola sediminis TaxID=2927980 RepID=A0AA48H7R3_9BACT|nr:Asp-tRNA(Asn)/Glu-tRNA(Gln) amidotransferase subunit GatB [Mesoterricola sediminis]BDU78886.1 aspartyl/glutamyl-tRNA(Asn/Gln) amidotransferase subunit B [Mesoterricola sediminis]